MNYKYLHPLYSEDDEQQAIDFLAKHAIDDAFIMVDGDDSDQEIWQHQKNKDAIMSISRDIVKKMYGVNVVDMANFRQVQDLFYKKYAPYILKYLNTLGYDAEIISFNPGVISSFAITKQMINDGNKTPLERFDPNVKWDYTPTNNIRENIMNPILAMDVAVLRIKNAGEKMSLLIKEMSGCKPTCDDLTIKLLPSKDFRNIQGLVDIINETL